MLSDFYGLTAGASDGLVTSLVDSGCFSASVIFLGFDDLGAKGGVWELL